MNTIGNASALFDVLLLYGAPPNFAMGCQTKYSKPDHNSKRSFPTAVLAIAAPNILISHVSQGSTPDNEKESLLSSASEFSGQEFTTALNNNPLKAKQDRIGNAYIFTGFFINITDTYGDFVLWMDGAQYNDFAQVNMSQEELININLTDIVRIVGTFDDYNDTNYKVVISPAYLLDDNITFEVTGIIADRYYNGRKLLKDSIVTVIDGDNSINLGIFGGIRLDMTDIQNWNTGDYITVRGSITHDGLEISIIDVTSYNIISEEEYYKMLE